MKHKWTYFIDASTSRTGITLLRDDYKKIIVTDLDFKYKIDKKLTKTEQQINKFKQIKKQLDEFVTKYPPMDTIYMEGIFVKSSFLNSSEVLLKFHGFLIMYFIDYQIEYFPPKTIKKLITGNGNAKKDEVRKTLENKYEINFKNEDQSDSFAVFDYFINITNIELHQKAIKVI